MIAIIQALTDGILVGGVYGVIAVGLSLVFGVLGIVNFAQAEFMMLGMYAAWFAWRYLGLDPLFGAVLSFAVVFCLGVLVQRFLIQHVMKAPPVAQIFLTVGILIVLENSALLLFGPDFRTVKTVYQTKALTIGPIFISVSYLAAFVAAVIVSAGLMVCHGQGHGSPRHQVHPRRSDGGHAVRRRYQVDLCDRFRAWNRFVGARRWHRAVLFVRQPHSVRNTWSDVHRCGARRPRQRDGALAGGVIVGMIQSLSTLVMPIQLQNLALFAIFIALLAFRPQGLLGSTSR